MAKSEMIRARVEPELKHKAESVLQRLGMTPTEAITLFYKQVTLYRGLPYDLPLGINLYSEVYAAPVQISDLSSSARSSATNHELRSKDDATSLVKDLTARARAPEPPAPLPTLPKPKPRPKPQKKPQGSRQQAASSKQNGGSTTGGKASGGGK